MDDMEAWQIICFFLALGLISWLLLWHAVKRERVEDESVKPGDVFAARDLRHHSVTLNVVDVYEGRVIYVVDNNVALATLNETVEQFKGWWPDRVRLPKAPSPGIGRAAVRSSRSPFG